MNLACSYLGQQLAHPFIVGASPMVGDLDVVRRLEDAGAAAIVMRSLFEEEIRNDELAVSTAIDGPSFAFAEAATYLPEPHVRAADDYLELIGSLREAIDIPLFASLNGVSEGRWLDYAEQLISAGADALELNLYHLPMELSESGSEIEQRLLGMVTDLRARLDKPIAIKLSPGFTSLPHFANGLVQAGADALVVFNRFYQADIEPVTLSVDRRLELSTSSELLLRLRWLAVLSAKLEVEMAVTGGVHTAVDAVKAIMAGASAVQLVSCLLARGPEYLATLRSEFEAWSEEYGYAYLAEMQGSMNLSRCPDPTAFERGNYMQVLRSWRGL